jgi:general secretion pathway protein H
LGHQGSGFTLIELLVVLAIIGLLMIAMVPTSVQIGAGVDVRSAASEIAANLRTARARALRTNTSTAVLFETAKSAYWPEGSSDVEVLPQGTTLQLFTVREEQWTGSVGAIRFAHDGTSSGGRVTIARDNRSYDVSVNWLTGRVSIDAR